MRRVPVKNEKRFLDPKMTGHIVVARAWGIER
jgi:hypothetical protein